MRRMGILIAALALAACASDPAAQTGASAGGDCFRSAEVNGYNVIDRNNIRVSVSANRHYVLTTAWDTHNLDWTEAIAIRSATGRICTGNGLGVELIGGEPIRTYPVSSITRALEDEPAADGS